MNNNLKWQAEGLVQTFFQRFAYIFIDIFQRACICSNSILETLKQTVKPCTSVSIVNNLQINWLVSI